MDPRLPHGRPPADYPHDLVSRIKLDEGGVLLVRPILPSDAERLADEIAHADAKTLYMRFFASPAA